MVGYFEGFKPHPFPRVIYDLNESPSIFGWKYDTDFISVEITLFFIVLYASLAGFWFGFLFLAQLRLPEVQDGPLYSDYLSHRGPGLHMYPKPSVVGRDKQKIFYLDQVDSYFGHVDSFLNNRNSSVDDKLGDCSADKYKGSWNNNKPCLFFYLNAVTLWFFFKI